MLRWREEKKILQDEMKWTRLSCEHRVRKWRGLIEGTHRGRDCYAQKQVYIWETLAFQAADGEKIMDMSM